MKFKKPKLNRKNIIFAVTILLIFTMVSSYFLFFNSKKVEAAWWNDSWGYRKTIAVTNSSGSDLTNFQVKALTNVDLSANITAGKVRSDLGDLRFTDIGGNVLPYWIEDTTAASVDAWVLMPTVPTSGATIYMYYGNPSAMNTNNITGLTTGGAVTTVSGYRIHTFLSSGTFTSGPIITIATLVVAGGGGGGSDMGGGGGGGGVIYNAGFALTSTSYPITIGLGGAGAPAGQGQVKGTNGQNSVFSTLVAIGGGGGASNHDQSINPAGNGGSGGGASGGAQPPSGGSGGAGGYGGGAAGTGTSGQGYNGSFGIWAWYPGGGGGAGAAGSTNPAHGGIGVESSILGTSYYWGGGGGGAGYSAVGGNGGNGGGGGGAVGVTTGGAGLNAGSPGTNGCSGCWANVPGGNAGANTGGGGGGGSHYNATNNGGNGGSGIVIVKYAVSTEPSAAAPSVIEEKGTGPIAYWNFDEGQGATAHDSTASNLNGSISGATWKSEENCISGKCLYFDGVSNYVSLPGSLGDPATFGGALGSWTLSGWIKPNDLGTNYRTVFRRLAGMHYLAINPGSKQLQVMVSNGVGSYNEWYTSASAIPANAWTYFTVQMIAGQGFYFYLNGKLDLGYANTGLRLTNYGADTAIAADLGGNQYYQGLADEFKIYSYARTAAQIKLDYSAGLAGVGGVAGEGVSVAAGGKSAKWLSEGLVGWWKMDEASWGSVVDSSGNGNNGAVVGGATVAAGKFGNGGSFDGSGDGINLGSPASLDFGNNGAFTFSGWVKPVALVDYASFVAKDTTGRNSPYSYMTTFMANGRLSAYNNSVWTDVCPAGSIAVGSWYHVAFDYNGTNLTGYINGSACGSVAFTYSDSSAYDVTIGSWYSPSTIYDFNGLMDDVRIYNRPLSPKEIRDLYNYAPGPVGYWNMEEGSGITVNDTSGNGYNSSAFDSPTWTTGKIGKALNFDGNDYINTAFPAQTLPALTVEAWVNPSSNATWRAITQSASSGDKALYLTSGYLHFYSSCNSNSTVPLNQWSHVAASVDSNNLITYYINGVTSGGCTSASSPRVFEYFHISGTGTGDGENFQGKIDDVKLYNYARTSDQIMEDMQTRGTSAEGAAAVSASGKTNVGYWEFDEGYGTTANDSSPRRNNGSISGATWTNNGKFGKALLFDGSNDYVDAGSNSSLAMGTGSFSIEAWVNSNIVCGPSWSDPVCSIASTRNLSSGVLEDGYYLGIGVNTIFFQIGDGSANNGDFRVNYTYTNSWHHIVAVRQAGSEFRLYIDGVLAGTDPDTLGDVGNTYNFLIGAHPGGVYSWNGKIDEVKVYNYALTADEIKTEYNHGSSMSLGDTALNPAGSQNSPGASCATIKTGNPKASDGIYWIKPVGSASAIQVYCDMTRDGGGWTLAVKSWYQAGIMGNTAAVGVVADATTRKGNAYKLADTDIRNLIGAGQNFDVMADQNGYNSYYSTGNYEYVILRNYTGYFRFDTVVAASITTTSFQSYRASDNALAWTGNLECGAIGGAGINCANVLSNNPQGGAGCNINMGTASNAGWHHFYMSETNQDTYLYICNGPQHSSSFDMNHRWWIRERSASQSFTGDYAPVGEWKFEEGSGVTANDTSGNGKIGTWGGTGSHWTTGKNGKAGKFNGSDDYVSLTHFLLPAGLTFGAWVKTTSTDSATVYDGNAAQNVIGDSTGGIFLGFGVHGGKVRYTHYASGWYNVTGNISVNDGKWHYISATHNQISGAISLYVDGRLDNTGTITYNTSAGVDRIGVGYAGDFFTGSIDDVKIYNYARTQAQVAYDYNRGAPVGWWEMDECQGSAIHDSSNFGNNGTWSGTGGGTQTSVGTCTTAGTAWGNGATGKINASLNFDGTDDYVSVGTPKLMGSDGVTFATWIKPAISKSFHFILGKGNMSSGNPATKVLGIGLTGNYLNLFISQGDSTGWCSQTSQVPITINSWSHVVATFNKTTQDVKLYVNGIQKYQTTCNQTGDSEGSDGLFIGDDSTVWWPSGFFNGQIDDARIYNYALTATQVKAIYNGGAVNFR